MRAYESRVIWGLLLILLGVIFLLQTMGLIPSDFAFIWIVLFGLAGLAFLYVYASARERAWWVIIPGFTFLGLAGVIAIGAYGPRSLGPLGGAFFLGMIGLSFAVVYLSRPTFWWAIIPAGTLLTLAVIAGSANYIRGEASGGILFLGLAATFAVLSLVPTPHGRLRWALIPAAVLFAMGALITMSATPVARYLWPLALILIGLYLLLRNRGTGPQGT
ncbi:MAG: hypothetical protein ACYC3S_12615 [Chloroflexota bacterium]